MGLFNESFYTDDFDQEMLDYVCNLGSISKRTGIDADIQTKYKYLKYETGCDYFWTNDTSRICGSFNYLTKQQFREKVGMAQKQFTKADLKDGMFVRLAWDEDEVYAKIGDYLISKTGFMRVSGYDDNLKRGGTWDVMEVMEIASDSNLGSGFKLMDNFTYKSIWKRSEPTPTPEQIEIESIQAEMDKLSQRLSELKGKV